MLAPLSDRGPRLVFTGVASTGQLESDHRDLPCDEPDATALATMPACHQRLACWPKVPRQSVLSLRPSPSALASATGPPSRPYS